MLKKLLSLFVLSILIISSLLHFSIETKAQVPTQLQGLSLSPAIQEIDADESGGLYKLNVEVKNSTSDRTYNLSHLTQTFTASDEDGVPVLKDFPDNSLEKKWVTYPEPLIKLAPLQTKTSQIMVNIPVNTSPGGYYFALVVGEINDTGGSDNNLLINSRVGALLFVNVVGDIKQSVSFEKFDLDKWIYDPFFDSIKVDYRIRVEGNTFLKPTGNLFFGTTDSSGSISVNPQGKIILPNSSRSFQTYIPATNNFFENLESKSPEPASTNVQNIEKPWFGQKDIEAKVLYTDLNQGTTQKIATTRVIFFPWKLSILIIFLVGLFTGIVFISKKSFSKFRKK